MSWKQTYTGKQYWPSNPDPADVCIEDIAHALSLICRFNGSCKQFYSVAQHSVLVSIVCDEGAEACLWGLLHDAAEAYLSDVPTPVKPMLMGYVDLEEKNLKAIAAAFDLPLPMSPCIKHIDRRMLATEKRDLMNDCEHDWPSLTGTIPYDMKIIPCSPEVAELMFLKRFATLTEYIKGARS